MYVIMRKLFSALLIGLLAICPLAGAKPVARYLDPEGIEIRVFDDKCKLDFQIKNLQYRAVWTDKKGKEIEGCAGPAGWGPVINLYFMDKTAFSLPVSIFVPIQEI